MSRMDAAPAGVGDEQQVAVRGGFADVLFFLGQVQRGALEGHYSDQFLQPMQLLMLMRRCCLALLRQALWPASRSGGDRFLVVRRAGRAVGALLLHLGPDPERGHRLLIDMMVVDPALRRRGIGALLLNQALLEAPLPCRAVCYCMIPSGAMMRLLRASGFTQTGRAEPMADGRMFPHCFELDRGAGRPGATCRSAGPAAGTRAPRAGNRCGGTPARKCR